MGRYRYLLRKYQVYVPFDYTPARQWPVILFLYGAGERGTDGLRQTQVGLGTAIRQNPRWFPAIVVLPQAPDSVWGGSAGEGALAALERSIREFHGDKTRLYLTGLSMGGYGAWTLELRRPTMFAAIVAVCGGLPHSSRLKQLGVPLSDPDPYAAFQEAGSPVEYTEYPGVGHNSWDPAFADSMLWEWLFAQRRAVSR